MACYKFGRSKTEKRAGVTPLVADRTYLPAANSVTQPAAEDLFRTNNPTAASSSAAGIHRDSSTMVICQLIGVLSLEMPILGVG